MNLLLYTATVFIWGSTWLGIHYQLGEVDPAVSLFYRFTIAATIMTAFCVIAKQRLRFSVTQHALMALQGVSLFALNYWFLYRGSVVLASGLVALIFSSIAVMNILNARLFLGKPIDAAVLAGTVIGLIGVTIVFAQNLTPNAYKQQLGAIGLCIAGTYLSSLGNILSGFNQARSVSVASGNAIAMIYASIFLAVFCLLRSAPFTFDYNIHYVGSLLYLAVFGSVLGFYFYLTLLGRIGADRAVYAMVLFPVIALVLSSMFEGLALSPITILGVAIVLIGNFVVLARPFRRFAISWRSHSE